MSSLFKAGDVGRLEESTSIGGDSYVTLDSSGVLRENSTVSTFTANGATPVTVADTRVNADSIIAITLKTVGGTVGALPRAVTITPGTGFDVNATAADTSVYNYRIL